MVIATSKPHCYRKLAAFVRPRERIGVSDWADRYRVLSTKQSGLPGRWSTRVNPMLREIMDCLSVLSPVKEIVVQKSNQVGITEAMVNALGYIMHHAPGPAMVLMPTLADRDTWKVQKLNPLLQDTKAVRDLLGGLRSRDAANRQDLIDFPGGVLFLSGGNSPNSYAQKTARWLFMDDLDRFPVEVGSEGDPVALARGRVKAYPHKHKIMLVSTPTVLGGSLIEREYLDSDMRRYHVPCPHCHAMQPLDWDRVRYDKETFPPESAWYECANCEQPIEETYKPGMLADGKWIAQRPEVSRRGYHISAIYAPIGLGPSWLDLAVEWSKLYRDRGGKKRAPDPRRVKAFHNLHLGETWEDKQTSVTSHDLAKREDPTGIGEIPPGVLALTVGIDTQDHWLDLTLIGWRQWQDDGQPAWVIIDWHQIRGDTGRIDPWDELERYLNTERKNAFGKVVRISAVGIDNRGHRGEQVKAFCQRQSLKVPVYRVQGSTTKQHEIIAATVKEPSRDHRGKIRRNPWGIWNVGTETVKDLIYGALASDGDYSVEDRRFRFAKGLPVEYYNGLLSETYNHAKRKYEVRPHKKYERNEPLDDLVYGIAIGFHREVFIALRRTKVRRDNGIVRAAVLPDPEYWKRLRLILEPEDVDQADQPPALDRSNKTRDFMVI